MKTSLVPFETLKIGDVFWDYYDEGGFGGDQFIKVNNKYGIKLINNSIYQMYKMIYFSGWDIQIKET